MTHFRNFFMFINRIHKSYFQLTIIYWHEFMNENRQTGHTSLIEEILWCVVVNPFIINERVWCNEKGKNDRVSMSINIVICYIIKPHRHISFCSRLFRFSDLLIVPVPMLLLLFSLVSLITTHLLCLIPSLLLYIKALSL